MTIEYVKGIPPIRPIINSETRGFWEALRRHELAIQRCRNCGLRVHLPRPMCPRCLSIEREWAPCSGKGTIHSWVAFIHERSGYPGFKVPYAVVLVDLDEGVRILAHVTDMKPEDLYIGMPVEAVFEDVTGDLTLVKFKRIKAK